VASGGRLVAVSARSIRRLAPRLDRGVLPGDLAASPAAVVQGITADKLAIGYSGIGYKTSDVKSLKLAAKDGGTFVTDDAANVYSGTYPLARFLYVYVNKAPDKPLGPLVQQFLMFVLSKDGQEIVIKDGYLPLLGKHVAEELPKLK